MRAPKSVKSLEDLGRARLSQNFFMRDFLYSEVSNFYGIPNIPVEPDVAIKTGKKLCEVLLEPLYERFGQLTVVSGYRSPELNKFCNEKKLNCASNEANYASHIWDIADKEGNYGACASIVVNSFADLYADGNGVGWQELAWWMYDHLDFSSIYFFPKLAAFNIQWRDNPERKISSYIQPKGVLIHGREGIGDQPNSEKYPHLL